MARVRKTLRGKRLGYVASLSLGLSYVPHSQLLHRAPNRRISRSWLVGLHNLFQKPKQPLLLTTSHNIYTLISLRRLVPWSLRQHFLALSNGRQYLSQLVFDSLGVQVQMSRGAAPSTVAPETELAIRMCGMCFTRLTGPGPTF